MINQFVEKEINESEIKDYFNLIKKEINVKENSIILNPDSLILYMPTLFDKLLDNPEETIEEMERAVELVFLKKKKIILEKLDYNELKIREIRVNNLNKLFRFKGVIKRITRIVPRTVNITYECSSCGDTIVIPQDKKKKRGPKNCWSCKRKGGFRVIKEEKKDVQELNLEELPEDLEGRQPQQLRIYLEEELTEKNFSGKLQPGKRVEVIGIVKTLPAFMSSKDEELNLAEFIVLANNIIPLDEEEMIITGEDEKTILEISQNNPLEKLAESLAPEIYGNDMVKKAIVLQMVKGVSKEKSDKSLSREDIHILLVGDPGVAKSVTLKATILRIPRARLIVGTKTSRVGLGAMAIKDELLNVWSLEAGALVLSSGSLLGLDEIDKLYKENLSELLEPMSSGTITINKAGISATLPAKTSILASANPIQGNFNLLKPLPEQIDLPPPILNRFDLIFVMLDIPKEEFDEKSVEHVFRTHQEKKEAEIPIDLFKKYIFYCRKLKPKVREDLLDDLKEFYITLRQKSVNPSTRALPINLRNVEGLIRLSEAHAKLRMSEYVEMEDLEVAKDIFIYCLNQLAIDSETGLVDTSRLVQKVPISKRAKMERLLDMIEELSKIQPIIPYEEILKKAENMGMKHWEINTYLEQLKKESQIYEPTNGVFSIS